MSLLGHLSVRWTRYAGLSMNRRIAASALVTALASVLPKAVAFVREIAVAAYFGVSGAIDVYVMALTLIGLPSNIFLGALQSTLIPRLVRWHLPGNSERDLFSSVFTITSVLMAVALGALIVASPWLIDVVGHGFVNEKKSRVLELLWWFIPYYFLSGVNLLGYAALQARKLFIHNGLWPVLVPSAMILLLVAVGNRAGVEVLVWGLTLGSLVEFITLNAILRKKSEMTLQPGKVRRDDELYKLRGEFVLLLPGTLIMSVMPLVGQFLASNLGDGAIAALNFGMKLPAAIAGLVVTALGVSALPFLSHMVADQDWRGCRHTLRRLSSWLFGMSLPPIVALAAISSWLIAVLFERGAFDSTAVEIVTPVQQAYLLQIPAMLVGMLATKLCLALGRTGTLTWVSVLSVAFYAALGLALTARIGISGIALAAAITSAANALALMYLVERDLKTRAAEDGPLRDPKINGIVR